jgi:hypothetical protein
MCTPTTKPMNILVYYEFIYVGTLVSALLRVGERQLAKQAQRLMWPSNPSQKD